MSITTTTTGFALLVRDCAPSLAITLGGFIFFFPLKACWCFDMTCARGTLVVFGLIHGLWPALLDVVGVGRVSVSL